MRLSAALLVLLGRYLVRLLDPFVTLLAAKNPVCFMQIAGELLRLTFTKGRWHSR